MAEISKIATTAKIEMQERGAMNEFSLAGNQPLAFSHWHLARKTKVMTMKTIDKRARHLTFFAMVSLLRTCYSGLILAKAAGD